MHPLPRLPAALLLLVALSACATLPGDAGGQHPAAPSSTPVPSPPAVAPYLDTLDRMAPGDPARQQAELDAALAEAQEARTSSSTLRYAVALGSAGHANSNPVEAKRLISELLASPNTLDPAEMSLATAFLREFDARVALYAELARQREESERKLQSRDAEAERRADALAAENRYLKRALADAERKLEAVAEMERSLLEPAPESGAEPPPRP